MSASNLGPGGTLDSRFLRAVEVWCARNGTVDRALAVMGEPPVNPAFLGEVEAILAVTGTKRSVLGQEATGNPSFVAQLRAGVSLGLATVESVRA